MHEIVKAAARNQVFVITHSPHFIDTEHLDGLTRASVAGGRMALSRFPTSEMNIAELATAKEILRVPEAREMAHATSATA